MGPHLRVRNYIKSRVIKVTYTTQPSGGGVGVAWGGSDDQLGAYVRQLQNLILQFNPTARFTLSAPQIVWWELNRENLCVLLNGTNGGQGEATNNWNNTRLPSFTNAGTAYYGISKVKEQGSPRKVWSHGH